MSQAIHIAHISFQDTWPIRHQVMWPDQPLDFIKLAKDEEGLHYGLYLNHKLISVVSAFIDGEVAQFRKFATLEKYQGKGWGSQLLEFVLDDLRRQHMTRIWCNARVEKLKLYERFGLVETALRFDQRGREYVVMEWVK